MSHSPSDGAYRAKSLGALLESVGVTKRSHIHVTGDSALSALIWLCSQGYDHVSYVRPNRRKSVADPDALIVAETCGEVGLQDALRLASRMRPGGILIVPVQKLTPALAASFERAIRKGGFTTERRLPDGSHDLIVARRRSDSFRKAA